MCKAKNNHCVMRKHSRAASGASSGYMQEGGGRNGEGGEGKCGRGRSHKWDGQLPTATPLKYGL